ncbi:SGNH/GDSL hydrolase family protein [Sphingomonas sp.]|uniref:SGNH/GDSL hydrolase family protein n=1 Tax=Sphingomonas sp. TaxID=28214 RepID=UPI002DD640B0|nr:SGNH/GDSL hydrolase family protein [Sphingomonas sp.]
MRVWWIAAAALALATAGTASAQAERGWTRAWTSSLWPADPPQADVVESATIRSQVRVGAGGPALRLRLGNDYGTAPVRIGAATIRRADGRIARVTFGGAGAARIEPGAPLVSDAVALPVAAFELVEVSLYLPDRVALVTTHGAHGSPTAVSPPGDHSGAAFEAARSFGFRPLIAGIDVQARLARPVVVAYGDSITDNTWCANASPVVCRWGDVLGRRMAKAGMPHVVVTQAIGGNRVLNRGTGPSALERFDRDVLAVPGVTHVVLLEGINDLGSMAPDNPFTAEDLIAAYRQMIARAHEHGIKVFASPMLPWQGWRRYSPEREAMRLKVNDWIRTGGAFDAVIELDRAVADPADPTRLKAELQSGDGIHPNAAGETAMGEAIPLRLFR